MQGRLLVVSLMMVGVASGGAAGPMVAAAGPSETTAVIAETTNFSDVPEGHTFADDIEWLASTGITQGREDGTFGLNDPVTRGAMAAFLYRYDGEPDGPLDARDFPDVPADHVFAEAITWLASTGITQGRDDGTFGLGDPVSRGAMAAFLYRYDGTPDGPFNAPDFPDVPADHVFAEAITWLASTGITQGRDDGTFGLNEPVTRGAMAAFLNRYHGGQGSGVLSVVTSELPPADRGLSYTTALEADGGQAPYEWEVEGLPEGVELTDAGLLQGMPLEEGTNQLQVTVTDATGATATSRLTLGVVDVGVPEACIGQECLITETAEDTVELSAEVARRIDVDDDRVEAELADITPDQLPAVGGHLVLAATSPEQPLTILRVDEIAPATDATVVSGPVAGLADAYTSGVLHATGHSPDTAGLAATPGLVSCSTEGSATVEVDLELSVDPIVYIEWSTQLFSGSSVERAGVHIFADAQMIADAQLAGEISCESGFPTLPIPVSTPLGVTAYVDITPVVAFDADAELGARFEYDYTCSAAITYTAARGLNDQLFCGPTRNQLKVDPLEATATLQAGLDTQISVERLIGITGDLRVGITGQFTPAERPAATLDLFVTGDLGGCIGCRFGDNAITGTLLTRTWGPTTIWESPTPPPTYTDAEPEAPPQPAPLFTVSETAIAGLPFGTPAEDVLAFVRSEVGTPSRDSGWVEYFEPRFDDAEVAAFYDTDLYYDDPSDDVSAIFWPWPWYREVCWDAFCVKLGGETAAVAAVRGWSLNALGPDWATPTPIEYPPSPWIAIEDTGITAGSTWAEVQQAYPHATPEVGKGATVNVNNVWDDWTWVLAWDGPSLSFPLVVPSDARLVFLAAGARRGSLCC